MTQSWVGLYSQVANVNMSILDEIREQNMQTKMLNENVEKLHADKSQAIAEHNNCESVCATTQSSNRKKAFNPSLANLWHRRYLHLGNGYIITY